MTANERDHTDNKGDKTGRSADEEGFFGDKRTQHYDAAGEPIGKSRTEKGPFGQEYVQHYDETGEETGRSRAEEGMFGDEYTQHYDSRGEKTGRSRKEKGLFGDEYVQHYNERGDPTGRTRVDEYARERHERERQLQESVKEAGRVYHANGALKLKDLRGVAWGPTFKLAFWRGVACAPGMAILIALLANGNIFERVLIGLGGAGVWALTAWYGAFLNYILWRAIGAVVGPLTLGIGYFVANFALLILAFIMSMGDPIIAHIVRRSPHFFQIDHFPTFSMKSMYFIVKGDEAAHERPMTAVRAAREQSRPGPPPAESTSPPRREREQYDRGYTDSGRAAEYGPVDEQPEPKRKGLPIAALIFGVLIVAAAGAAWLSSGANFGASRQAALPAPSASQPSPAATEAVDNPSTADDQAFEAAIAQGTVEALEAFVSTYPDSSHASVAYTRLAELADLQAARARAQDFAVFRDCDACPQMIVIPAGAFTMGAPLSEAESEDNERPQHQVSVAQFAIGKFEVTFDEWAACVQDGGCTSNPNPNDRRWGQGLRPVMNVSWNDAQEYLAWLSSKTGQAYRLPSEAEWEYAARAGTQTPHWTGQAIGYNQAQYSQGRTREVGSYPANPFGLHDTIGNVWEFTQDCWHEGYAGAPVDGAAWVNYRCDRRVVRGGSFDFAFQQYLRSAYRAAQNVSQRHRNEGFRVARSIVPGSAVPRNAAIEP